jgi:hypothetical protein
MTIMMRKKTDSVASPDFAIFVLGLEQKYGASLDEILDAVAGLVTTGARCRVISRFRVT